jgi:hypothetical protein
MRHLFPVTMGVTLALDQSTELRSLNIDDIDDSAIDYWWEFVKEHDLRRDDGLGGGSEYLRGSLVRSILAETLGPDEAAATEIIGQSKTASARAAKGRALMEAVDAAIAAVVNTGEPQEIGPLTKRERKFVQTRVERSEAQTTSESVGEHGRRWVLIRPAIPPTIPQGPSLAGSVQQKEAAGEGDD